MSDIGQAGEELPVKKWGLLSTAIPRSLGEMQPGRGAGSRQA